MPDALSGLTTALADRYRIERELGQGGMATVYLAEDLKHHRKVAIKILRRELAAALGTDRFLREVRIAANLSHPNILPVHDSGEAGGFLYYTMPYVAGESLRDRLTREGKLPIPEAVRLLAEMADALACAHGQGVVHRDVKPENVLLAGRHAMVMDFGIAKALAVSQHTDDSPMTQSFSTLTTVGMVVGTPAYMAPEQAAGDPTVDHRADLYALGIVGYELLTGAPPFQATTPQQVLAAQIARSPEPVLTGRPELPADLADLVMRCLAKSPEDRWQSAEEIVGRIEALGVPASRRPTRWTGRRIAAIAGALILLVALTLGVLRPGGRAGSDGSANVLAVLPFTVRGSPELAYLGEGIVDLLSASLDGAAGLRTVNAHALLGFVGRSGSEMSTSRASGVAQHFQAGLYVVGDVLEVEGKLRFSASLFDRKDDAHPLAEATVDGDPGDVLALVDLLATRLAADRLAEGGARLTRAAAVTTSSLPALKAYLTGEQAYRAGQYAAAATAFQEAVAADTAFALAFYRLGMAQERLAWAHAARQSADLAFLHSSRLSDHDRRFLEAVVAMRRGRSGDAEQQFHAIVQAYPDDAEAWYQLGELLFHGNPLRGGSMTDAREPFTRALFFDPGDLGALYHLVRIAARDGNQTELDSLAARFYQLSPAGDRTLELRWLQASTRRDSAGLDSVNAALGRAADGILPLAAWSAAVFAHDIPGARRIARLMTEPSRSRDVRAQGHILLAHLALALGQVSAAWRELDAAGALNNAERPLSEAWFRVLPFVPQSRSDLAAARSRLAAWDASEAVNRSAQASAFYSAHNGVHQTLKTYLLGLLDARLGDTAGAMHRAAELDSTGRKDQGSPLSLELAQGLRAQVAATRSQADSALATLAAVRIEGWYELTFLSPFYSGALERFTRSELLRELGRGEQALGWYRSLGENTTQELVFLGPATLAQARIQRALGHRREAAELYDAFLNLWRESDPALRPIVDSAGAERAGLSSQEH
jgi:tRNA A-37 threonylcarbamoyl transferase component Bud32/TolB-like protein